MAATMNKSSGGKLKAAAAMLLLAAVVLATLVAEAEAECGVDVTQVMTNCQAYVKKGGKRTPPSKQCCDAIKGGDITCACQKLLTPAIQNLLDMNNVVYVGRTCGLSIPAGTKCGQFVVPPMRRR